MSGQRSERASRALLSLLVALAFVVAAGCAGSSEPAADIGDSGGDTGIELDAEPRDVAIADTNTDAADVVDDTDIGGIGEACEDNVDCPCGVCLKPLEAEPGVCTCQCVDDSNCPDEYTCELFIPASAGADPFNACFPDYECVDEDNDGFGEGLGCLSADCNDDVFDISPAAREICDGIDNDCDDIVDEETAEEGASCDTGLLGTCGEGRQICVDGEVSCEAVVGALDELCDGLDNDCDDTVDEGVEGGVLEQACFDADAERAGVGQCRVGVQTCEEFGFSACVGQVLPSPEVCDGIDNDCDTLVDETLAVTAWYEDRDDDGFGDVGGEPVESCTQPVGFVDNNGDCDDNAATGAEINPLAEEVPADGIDQDCDGEELCFIDTDDDGYHSGIVVVTSTLDCSDDGQAAASEPGGDCNDGDDEIHPGADEIAGDEVDQNCDRQELCYRDHDNDGYRTDVTVVSVDNTSCGNNGEAASDAPTGDCNDDNSLVFPDARELCDEIDNDCDFIEDEEIVETDFYPDADDDGFGDSSAAATPGCIGSEGMVPNNLDCNDDAETGGGINPLADEIVGDGIDQDCDDFEICWVDGDGDGYHAGETTVSTDLACDRDEEADASTLPDDCNDRNASINPGASEVVGNEVDDDCSGGELCYVDADNDGHAVDSSVASTNLSCANSGEASDEVPRDDCDDESSAVHPGASELIDDGVDQDCSGGDLCYVDADDDGYRPADGSATVASADLDCEDMGEATAETLTGDCNDAVASVRPGVIEVCGNSQDDNCDTTADCFDLECGASDMCYFGNNYDFEDWTYENPPIGFGVQPAGSATVVPVPSSPSNGAASASLTWTAGTASTLRSSTAAPANSAWEYTFHTWLRDTDSNGSLTPAVQFLNTSGALVGGAEATAPAPNRPGFREYMFRFFPSEDAATLRPMLHMRGEGGSTSSAVGSTDDWALTLFVDFSVANGTLDAAAYQVAENAGWAVHAGLNNAGELYIATERAPSSQADRFLYFWVGRPADSLIPVAWGKRGQIAGASEGGAVFVLAQEESNAYCELRRWDGADWVTFGDSAECSRFNFGEMLEGKLDLPDLLGLGTAADIPATFGFAALNFGRFDNEAVIPSQQVPAASSSDDDITADEVFVIHRADVLTGRVE